MATIKSYTDIEQSKKLAKILPLESADMYYPWYIEEDGDTIESGHRITTPDVGNFITHKVNKMILPCWSLVALLELMPPIAYNYPVVQRSADANYHFGETYNKWFISYVDLNIHGEHKPYRTAFFDNPIDACVAMIEKLNELNLL